MNVKLSSCAICEHVQNELREHCAVCGARRNYLAGHSFEPTRVIVRAMNFTTQREVVRAIRSDIGFKFVAR